jgi:manganese/zinc/iron transport system permease protein
MSEAGESFLSLILRVFTLQDYNTRLVVQGATLLGIASGCVGSFVLLRKRSLMGDVLSHATLPGIAIAFLVATQILGYERSQFVLLLGAALSGVLGVLVVLGIRNTTKLKDDAAMGLVLSVFFGFGVALLGMIQSLPQASMAGLERFIYGKTASMVNDDVIIISIVAVGVIIVMALLAKEFTLVCFDESFARSLGWPVLALDILMLSLLTLVTVVGLQAVGLILVIAFLIIPAAAARFWSRDLRIMVCSSCLIGGVSGWLGASLSALLVGLPGGAVIVLVAAAIFVVSMIFGTESGVLKQYLEEREFNRKVAVQHLMRACYELREAQEEENLVEILIDDLLSIRAWTKASLSNLLDKAVADGLVERFSARAVSLTHRGWSEARKITRNHRLWELYLINFADIAPSHVDRGADSVEHVLDSETIRLLEAQLGELADKQMMPDSPHR